MMEAQGFYASWIYESRKEAGVFISVLDTKLTYS